MLLVDNDSLAFELLFNDQLLLEKLFQVMSIMKTAMRVPFLCLQIMKSVDVEASSGMHFFHYLVCFLVK